MLAITRMVVAILTVLACCISLRALRVPLQKRAMSGRATWFYPGLGSCGGIDKDSDFVVALSSSIASSVYCNRFIVVIDPLTGRNATALVRDTCPSCGPGDLDMSPALFQQFRNLDVGTFNMYWYFK